MKKMLVILAAFLVLAAFAPRSAAADVTFDLGIKGGVSFARVNWIDAGEEDPSTTLTQPVFGGFASINLSKVFSIQPEVYWLTRGGRWTEDILGTITKWVEKWGYIHVPVLAKVHLTQGSKAIPVLFAGPALNINLSAKGKIYEDGVLVDEYDFKDGVRSPTFSLVLGGGAEMALDKIMLIVDIRYDIGLTNPVTYIDENVKFGTLMVMVGVGF